VGGGLGGDGNEKGWFLIGGRGTLRTLCENPWGNFRGRRQGRGEVDWS